MDFCTKHQFWTLQLMVFGCPLIRICVLHVSAEISHIQTGLVPIKFG